MENKTSLHNLLNDRLHGSSVILNLFLSYLEENSSNLSHIKSVLPLVKSKLGYFPAIQEIVKAVEIPISNLDSEKFLKLVKKFKRAELNAYKKIFKNAAPVLKKCKTILTISHSKTLIEIFKLWNKDNPKLKVYVCESRPLNEGLLLAEELKKNKIKSERITEAFSSKIIKQVDALIIGADQILKDGSIVNKTGSRILSILANYENVPVYVAAGKSKFVNNLPQKLPDEFEIVEAKLITKIFTD